MLFRVVVFILLFISVGNISVALVGLDENKNGNIPPSNIATKNKPKMLNNKKKNTNNNEKQNNKNDSKSKNKNVISGAKPSNIPDIPNDDEEYKMLFDDGFSNVIEKTYQTGEEFDVFVNQDASNEINKKYFAGNDDDITQMDAINAEKKTMVDENFIDKNNVTTHRTRVMAYLTLDQMLFSDLFGTAPHGYYVNVANKKG